MLFAKTAKIVSDQPVFNAIRIELAEEAENADIPVCAKYSVAVEEYSVVITHVVELAMLSVWLSITTQAAEEQVEQVSGVYTQIESDGQSTEAQVAFKKHKTQASELQDAIGQVSQVWTELMHCPPAHFAVAQGSF